MDSPQVKRQPRRIQSPRLLIRCWQPDDVDLLIEAVDQSLDHLRPWMPWIADEPLGRTERLALMAEWEEAWASGGDVIYGAFLRPELTPPGSEPVVIGGAGLHHRLGPGGLEIGYWVHAHHTRQGYATEVAKALVDAAFAEDEIDRVEIHHDQANRASAGIPETLGFRYVGTEPSDIVAPAESGRECAWRTTRTEWFA